MATLTISEAQSQLSDIIHRLAPGEEVVITENNRPVAKIVAAAAVPKLGTQKGSVLFMAPDFNAPLEDFKESME